MSLLLVNFRKTIFIIFLLISISLIWGIVYSEERQNFSEKYSIFFAQENQSISLTNVEPKIFSPDEYQSVSFHIENPNFSEVRTLIFSIDGSVVRNNLPYNGENIIYWDGRDNDNDIVSSGVYLFQIEADNKIINGTVVVAR